MAALAIDYLYYWGLGLSENLFFIINSLNCQFLRLFFFRLSAWRLLIYNCLRLYFNRRLWFLLCNVNLYIFILNSQPVPVLIACRSLFLDELADATLAALASGNYLVRRVSVLRVAPILDIIECRLGMKKVIFCDINVGTEGFSKETRLTVTHRLVIPWRRVLS